ncbi:hypothetical protein [Anaerobacillus alkalilacustris]|nr:hypothetical protein [Anaerobacillus alkalilacustris]
MMNFLVQAWHKCLMNYNYTLYQDCNDPEMKEQFLQKATFHSNKI